VSRRPARRDAVRRAPFLHAFATRRRRGTRPSAVQGSGLGAQATTPGDPAVVGTAAALLARARAARLAQDTALRGYDALARERITAAFALREGAPSTTVFRQETAARVRWSRGAGLALDLLGRRRYAIGRGAGIQNVAGDDLAPVPYYPGRDALWVGGGRFVRADVDTSSLVHPLAAGAERFYRYALGGEVTVRLPDGTAVPLRELRVTAVRPDWKLSTGSFWFDARDGQLVRAVYRVSGRMDLWATARASGGGPPAWARPFAAPMTGQLDVVTVEHGLYAGRFWLPRAQFARGTIRTGSSRIGVRVEQTFRYDAVDAAVPLGEVTTGALAAGAARDSLVRADSTAAAVRDSLVRLAGAANAPDARRARAAYRAWADSTWRRYRATRAARDRDECAASGATTATASATRYGRRLGDVRVHVPCDTAALAASPVFGGSGVLDENPSAWAGPERGTLVAGLDAAVPSAWAPQPLRLAYGHEFVRANRVEGVSYGAALRRELGAGWRWEAARGSARATWSLTPNWPRSGRAAGARCAGAHTGGSSSATIGARASRSGPRSRTSSRVWTNSSTTAPAASSWPAAARATRSPAAGWRGASSASGSGARAATRGWRCRRCSASTASTRATSSTPWRRAASPWAAPRCAGGPRSSATRPRPGASPPTSAPRPRRAPPPRGRGPRRTRPSNAPCPAGCARR
jgi:hypothetical protein